MTAIKYAMPKDAAELAKMCAKAVKSVQSARVSVQQAAVGVLYHAFKHGDYTAATTLVNDLGNTINGAALVEFFKVYGGLKINEEQGCFDGWQGKQFIEDNFNDAKAKMWWELKVKQPFKGFDLEAALQQVIKRHKEAQEKIVGMTPEDQAKVNVKVNDATIQQVLAMCNFEAIIGEAVEGAQEAA